MNINNFYTRGFIPAYVYELYGSWIDGDLHKTRKSDEIALRIFERLNLHLTTPVSFYKIAKESGIVSHITIRDYLDILEKMFVLLNRLYRGCFFSRPLINKIKGVPVYAVEQIYAKKILAIIDTQLTVDAIGRERITGRNQARDVVDLYFLSQRVLPLRQFLKKIQRNQRCGLVQWYRSFSRQEFKLDFLDINI